MEFKRWNYDDRSPFDDIQRNVSTSARDGGFFTITGKGGGESFIHIIERPIPAIPRRGEKIARATRYFASRNLRPRVILTTGNKRAKREGERERERSRTDSLNEGLPSDNRSRPRQSRSYFAICAHIYVRCTKANISGHANEDRAVASRFQGC